MPELAPKPRSVGDEGIFHELVFATGAMAVATALELIETFAVADFSSCIPAEQRDNPHAVKAGLVPQFVQHGWWLRGPHKQVLPSGAVVKGEACRVSCRHGSRREYV